MRLLLMKVFFVSMRQKRVSVFVKLKECVPDRQSSDICIAASSKRLFDVEKQ